MEPAGRLSLLDWKRQVFDAYREVRTAEDHRQAWAMWRSVRDDLFAHHAQSPVPPAERGAFRGLPFFDYDPAYRVVAVLEATAPERFNIATSGEEEGSYAFTRFAIVRFELGGTPVQLDVYWLEGYGGGVFLPFRDATSGRETYGAGRYLFDTVKGADLGTTPDGRLVLDFNFAYNPSCAYDPRWVCPLAPPNNRLAIPIRAGERYPTAAASL
jgi:uncharacterized protein (DUF1684 family)